ncbi:MAG: hypothetical protein KF819_05000 [Labilithrix sp.]|nr:hypothetical protein [Labilithrix sp.]
MSAAPRCRRWSALLVALALAVTTADARANGPEGKRQVEPARAAQDLYKKGAEKFRTGDFEGALALLEQAYALDPHPVLVYNIARAHEGLGALDAAVRAYEEYVALAPTASDRGAVESRVAALKKQIAERAELERRASERTEARVETLPARDDAPATAPPAARSPVPWIVAGAGVTAGIAGGVLHLVASSRYDGAVSEPSAQRAAELESSARSLQTTANIVLIAGIVVAVSGVVVGLLSGDASNKSTAGGPPWSRPLAF